MNPSLILEKVEDLVAPIVHEEGFELYDVGWSQDQGRNFLRIMVEKKDGSVTLDDCARVSRQVEDLIEVKGLISSRYDLQVSSPGMDRPLRKKEHFRSAVDSVIKVKTSDPIDGRRNYKGRLVLFDDEQLLVEVDQQEFKIPFELVSRANVEPW